MSKSAKHPGLIVGAAYKCHTHLGIWVGRISAITLDEITLDACSWIEDEGRMGACVRDGTYVASEYVGDGVVVPRNAIKIPWRHELRTTDK